MLPQFLFYSLLTGHANDACSSSVIKIQRCSYLSVSYSRDGDVWEMFPALPALVDKSTDSTFPDPYKHQSQLFSLYREVNKLKLWDYNESCRCFGTFELNIPKNS